MVTQDRWSADTIKMSFLGMTAHWIEVKEGKWEMRAGVIGFKALSGAHSGDNLGSGIGSKVFPPGKHVSSRLVSCRLEESQIGTIGHNSPHLYVVRGIFHHSTW